MKVTFCNLTERSLILQFLTMKSGLFSNLNKPILLLILFSVEIQEIFDVFFWALLKTVEIRGSGNLLLLKLGDF